MKRDRLALGLLLLWLVSRRSQQKGTIEMEESGRYQWPLPLLRTPDGAYPPTVSNPMALPKHKGADIDYPRRYPFDQRFGGRNGTLHYWCPPGVMARPVASGRLWHAGLSRRGWEVVIDHGDGLVSYYQHLKDIAVPRAVKGYRAAADGTPTTEMVTVDLGTTLGQVGYDLSDNHTMRHLHLEVWKYASKEPSSRTYVDPSTFLKAAVMFEQRIG